ncbi:MAG: phosphonate ABC transporter ATP-binding protein [Bacteroidetes bacterium HGW-Bacteroidetes-1]|jgi:putative ABC transport system ATP-binding protein|nr:MAG: phosphonate ABC transporter ATP-binding protein [Bacteroidetes bacterium HGW-Bacteroidetes-1]
MELIRTIDLTKVYLTSEIETTALHNINLTINEGEFIAVMGPSGCGKTTFLNLIGMLDTPTEGRYFFMSDDISRYNEKKRAVLRKVNLGFVFQDYNLIKELTVFDNVMLPLQYVKMSNASRKEKVNNILKQLEIGARASHYPNQLSGGQQQRVAIARALVVDPRLIIADEPTGNLDSLNGSHVMQLFSRIHKTGKTIIIVTHSDEVASYAQRIVYLKDGKIID